jgi:wyosine [tRNA(Phe)-imidazoG37] synthetase (radical SAM superfamily)
MPEPSRRYTRHHSRSFQENTYVYPVISRRSRGLSIGINLSPTALCNFQCIYCQIGRDMAETAIPAPVPPIDLELLGRELRATIELATSGRLFEESPFREVPFEKRRLNDLAFSGAGEPTMAPEFAEAVNLAGEIRETDCPESTKLVLITNATLLHTPRVRKALEVLAAHHGEIWAKLDAGTPEAYDRILRSRVPFERILENLAETARWFPLVIQSLFMKIREAPPPEAEIDAYCRRLREILDCGGSIQVVHAYTVARSTAEAWVAPLERPQLDAIAEKIRHETGLKVETFYST